MSWTKRFKKVEAANRLKKLITWMWRVTVMNIENDETQVQRNPEKNDELKNMTEDMNWIREQS